MDGILHKKSNCLSITNVLVPDQRLAVWIDMAITMNKGESIWLVTIHGVGLLYSIYSYDSSLIKIESISVIRTKLVSLPWFHCLASSTAYITTSTYIISDRFLNHTMLTSWFLSKLLVTFPVSYLSLVSTSVSYTHLTLPTKA